MTSFFAGQRLTGGQLQRLATDSLLVGTELVTFASAVAHIRTVLLGTTLPAPPAIVNAVISSGAGSATGWNIRTDTYTATSFRLLLDRSDVAIAWTNIPVIWQAVGPL